MKERSFKDASFWTTLAKGEKGKPVNMGTNKNSFMWGNDFLRDFTFHHMCET